MNPEFEGQCAQLLASWRAILRATPGLDATAEEPIVEALRRMLLALAPIETLKLTPLLDPLASAGVRAAQREAALLCLEQRGHHIGVPCALPAELASMPPGERRRAVQALEASITEALPDFADDDDWRDRTPSINMKDLVVNDPAVRTASLQAIAGHAMGHRWRIDREVLVIGRSDDADLRIVDEGISRQHARVARVGDRHVLIDLGSRNGVVVNGFGVSEHELEDGDRIQLGASTILRFAYHDQLEQDFQDRVLASVSIDPVTGLLNRRGFLEQLRSECAWCGRHGTPLSYLAIGIDDFDTLLDRRGHAVCGAVLKTTAAQLRKTLRIEDVLGRTDDGVFGLLLRGILPAGAQVVADRLRLLVEEEVVEVAGHTQLATISVGIATSAAGQDDVAATLQQKAELRLGRGLQRTNTIVTAD